MKLSSAITIIKSFFQGEKTYSMTQPFLIITLALILFCLLPLQPISAIESDWTVVLGPHPRLSKVVYGNNIYVAIGDGSMLTSEDGRNWSLEHFPGYNISGITWTGEQFMAIGPHVVLTSADGRDWTEKNPGIEQVTTDVAWGNGRFVAVGRTAYTSQDGENWTGHRIGTDEQLLHVDWGNNIFVAVAGRYDIVTSPDGENWTEDESPIVLRMVRWLNDRFFAVGNGILTSSDGLNWQLLDWQFDSQLIDIVWDGSKYIAVGTAGNVYTSPDGTTWTKENSGTTGPLTSVALGQNQLVAVGWGETFTSPDGKTWEAGMSGTYELLCSAIWENGQFYALGDTTYSSPDGRHWLQEDWPGGIPWPLRAAAWGRDRWVAVGWYEDNSGFIYTFDGKEWQNFEASSHLPQIADVIWVDDEFIAISKNVFTSPDGLDWTEQETGVHGAILLSIVEGGDRSVAVGMNGKIATSPNGITWAVENSGTGENLRGIAWDDNLYVAVGDNGIILSSPDGTNWTKRESGTDNPLSSVAWGDGIFVATGGQGTILVSANGIDWHVSPSGVSYWLSDVAWGEEGFIVSGEYGLVLYATTVTLAASIPPPAEEPDDEPDPVQNPEEQPDSSLSTPWLILSGLAALLLVVGSIVIIRAKAKTSRA